MRKVLTLTLTAAAAALAIGVLAPWRILDAAAPDAGDDPFRQGAIAPPTPLKDANRGLQAGDSERTKLLGNWHDTDNTIG